MPYASNATIFKRRVGLVDAAGAEGGGMFLVGVADPSAGAGVAAAVGTMGFATDGTWWRKSGAGATAWVAAGGGSAGITNPMPDDAPLFFGTASPYGVVYDSASTSLLVTGIGADATAKPLLIRSKESTVTSGAVTVQSGDVVATGATDATTGKTTITTGAAVAASGDATSGNLALVVGSATSASGTALRGNIEMTATNFKPPAYAQITTASAPFRYTSPSVITLFAATGTVDSDATVAGEILAVFLRKTSANGGIGADAQVEINGSTVFTFDLSAATQDDFIMATSLAETSFAVGDTISLALTGADPQCAVTILFATTTA